MQAGCHCRVIAPYTIWIYLGHADLGRRLSRFIGSRQRLLRYSPFVPAPPKHLQPSRGFPFAFFGLRPSSRFPQMPSDIKSMRRGTLSPLFLPSPPPPRHDDQERSSADISPLAVSPVGCGRCERLYPDRSTFDCTRHITLFTLLFHRAGSLARLGWRYHKK